MQFTKHFIDTTNIYNIKIKYYFVKDNLNLNLGKRNNTNHVIKYIAKSLFHLAQKKRFNNLLGRK